jgi:uncharacterized membrane protein YgdD (TMEM256/DUF423 family)
MNIQRVKQGANITYYNGIYMILLGLYNIFFTGFNMKSNFDAISQLWGFFAKYNSPIAKMFYFYSIVLGVMLVSEGVVIMYLSDYIFKRKEKMTWVILFLSGIISWAGLLTVSILFKNTWLIILTFLGWLTFVIGMIIPIRYYLEKNYKEY